MLASSRRALPKGPRLVACTDTVRSWRSGAMRLSTAFWHDMDSPVETKFRVSSTVDSTSCGKVLVVPVTKNEGVVALDELFKNIRDIVPVEDGAEDLVNAVDECIRDRIISGAKKEKYTLRSRFFMYKHVTLIGVGSKLDEDSLSILGNEVVQVSRDLKSNKIDVLMTSVRISDFQYLLNSIGSSSYNDERFKTFNEHRTRLEEVGLVGISNENLAEASSATQKHALISKGVVLAKDLVGAPSNSKTPIAIAKLAKDIASLSTNMECKVLGESECEALKMGSYLAVQQGSKYPPQFIHITYRNKNTQSGRKIALVGKGLTFDSGGYNLKVGAGSMIEMMKFDMGGLGAVLGTARAVAALDTFEGSSDSFDGLELHFISAVCENMVSRDAMRPGDIVTASNGKTIEVKNTDAEGRLTLADALVYAERVVGADVIVDIATLTGASMVALGEDIGNLFVTGNRIKCDMLQAAEASGDKIWHMPLYEKYREGIVSKIADIKNTGESKAGSITAALFLREFVEKNKEWAHIDMAGPVWNNAHHKPTGFGVRLLSEYILRQAQRE